MPSNVPAPLMGDASAAPSQRKARAIAVLGSASDVGKSLVTAALCRLLTDAGFDTAPFKAQNMANQAGVSAEGLEMPRAQILQALACNKKPTVDMGPVLMKPVSLTGAQIVVLGKAVGIKEAKDYFGDTARLAAIADSALDRLMAVHDVVVMEGAGSPVELNLWPRDFTNLRPARHANAAIVLVVDINRGGSFAQAKGTIDLLPEEDRKRMLGIVVNQFRGDMSLFDDGIGILEEICKVPVLAVISHFDHGLDEEDQPLHVSINEAPVAGKLHIGLILYPRVSNTEELAPLLAEPDVQLTWVTDPRLVEQQDLLILPGTKATLGDLVQITTTGMANAISKAAEQGTWVLGLCGGYQMLGRDLQDQLGSEGGPASWRGLGLLPFDTAFSADKVLGERVMKSAWPERDLPLTGYEIHHGRSDLYEDRGEPLALAFGAELGWRNERVVGGYLHGLLGSNEWRSAFLNQVRHSRGLVEQPMQTASDIQFRITRWAEHVKAHLLPGAWGRILDAVQ